MKVGDLVRTGLGVAIIIKDISDTDEVSQNLTKFRVVYLDDNLQEGEWFKYQMEVINESR